MSRSPNRYHNSPEQLTREQVPPMPADAKAYPGQNGRDSIAYDAVLDGDHCRWRYDKGDFNKLILFIRYGEREKPGDAPTQKQCWSI